MKTKIEETVEFLSQVLEDFQFEMDRPCYPYGGTIHSALEDGKHAVHNALVELVEFDTRKAYRK